MVNASENIAKNIEDDCFQRAWQYGTEMGQGDPYWEWYYTNKYYNENCRNQGLQ